MIHFANGTTLEPFDHPYNTTALNERAVELAMVHGFVLAREHDLYPTPAAEAGVLGRCLEVGNVLSHYEDYIVLPPRRVVDRFEVAPGVENIDVFDIKGTYDTIISISTIEHVGVDDGRGYPGAALDAIFHLRSLLAPGGRFFCTFPTGWNSALDHSLNWGEISRLAVTEVYVARNGEDWGEYGANGRRGFYPRPYGLTQPWAEAVWIGEFAPLVTNP
jgi:hypothetical protein